jgi:hypothetical protein
MPSNTTTIRRSVVTPGAFVYSAGKDSPLYGA